MVHHMLCINFRKLHLKNATFDTGIIWLCVLLYTVLILCLPDRDFDDKKDKQFIEDKTLVGTIIYLENCQ